MDQKDYLYDLLVHDLKNPLSVITATTKGLLAKSDRYGPLSATQEEALRRIARNTKKAQALLSEILDLARSEERLFCKDNFYFYETIKESIINVMEYTDAETSEKLQQIKEPAAEKKVLDQAGITVEISGKYEKKPFYHDKRKIQLILENLISNAMKYRKKNMKITIQGEQNVTVLVTDDGSGIPLDEQDSVFGRFVQLSNATCTPIQGLGLGLYCVKALLDTMGGDISLVSKAGSTTFTANIPPLQ